MSEEPDFKKRASLRAGQTLPKEAPFYLFCVFADHTLRVVMGVTVIMVVAIMAMTVAGAKVQKSVKLSLPLRDWQSGREKRLRPPRCL